VWVGNGFGNCSLCIIWQIFDFLDSVFKTICLAIVHTVLPMESAPRLRLYEFVVYCSTFSMVM
jgi:hypothetical protein